MRNSLRFAVVGAIAAASFAGSAQAATTATGNATAEVLSSLTVTSTADLLFGQIAANTGGTVTVNADATVASSGTLISTGSRSPAAFNVAGSPNAMVLVSLPTTPVNLTRSGGTEPCRWAASTPTRAALSSLMARATACFTLAAR